MNRAPISALRTGRFLDFVAALAREALWQLRQWAGGTQISKNESECRRSRWLLTFQVLKLAIRTVATKRAWGLAFRHGHEQPQEDRPM